MKRRWKRGIIAALSLVLAISTVPVMGAEADVNIYGASKLTHNPRYQNFTLEYGIDVSHHQEKIDWKKVKEAGIDFAIIRVAARGTSKNGGRIYDKYAKQNLDGATKYGIPFGVYVYSQALTVKEAQEEADWVLEAIEGYQLQLPVVFDYEYADGGRLKPSLSKTKKTNNCLAFCKKIEAAGYTPMLYANKSFLENDINTPAISQFYPIWLAHYSNKTSYEGVYDYWQYTSNGSVDGIKGKVDMNVRYVEQTLRIESANPEQITLRWNPHANAKEYEIYRLEDGGKDRLLDTIGEESCTYADTVVKPNVLYTYQIRAILKDGTYSSYSASTDACASITAVPELRMTNNRFDRITVGWKASNLAHGYELWRYDTQKKQYVCKAELAPGTTSYTDTNLTASTQYRYRLRLFRWNGKEKMYSAYGTTFQGKTSASVKAKVTVDHLNIRSQASTSGKILKSVKKGTFLSLTGGCGDWYQIRMTIAGKQQTAYVSAKYVKIIWLDAPTLSVKTRTFDTVRLQWKKQSGAFGYQLQRYNKTKKQYETIKNISSSALATYTDSSKNASTTYKYRVRAWKKNGSQMLYGEWSKTLSVKTKAAVRGKTKAKLHVRKNAGTGHAILKTLKKGKQIQITGSKGSWYRVSVTIRGKKKTGYVSKKYVKL